MSCEYVIASANMAGLEADCDVELKKFPAERSVLEKLISSENSSVAVAHLVQFGQTLFGSLLNDPDKGIPQASATAAAYLLDPQCSHAIEKLGPCVHLTHLAAVQQRPLLLLPATQWHLIT